jgi:hypothetical protein
MYRNVPNVGRVKASGYRQYLKQFNDWLMMNSPTIKALAFKFSEKETLSAHILLGCKYSRIWTKKGKPKKFDCQNRQKIMLDLVAKAIGIDDSNNWKVTVEKAETEESDQESVSLVLSHYQPRKFSQAKKQLIGEMSHGRIKILP